jgi:hypothetical protein
VMVGSRVSRQMALHLFQGGRAMRDSDPFCILYAARIGTSVKVWNL